MRSSSSPRGFWTLSTTSAPSSAACGDGSTRAPASRYSPSWKPEASPASDSRQTSIPALTIFSTVAGTAATRLSPSASSFKMAAFISPQPPRSAAGDVDVQLVDEELLLVEHEDDHVAHRDDAGDPAILLHQQVARVVIAHQGGALALRRGRVDAGEIAAHGLGDGRLAGPPADQAPEDQVALADEPDDAAALLHGDGADPLLRHELRGLAARRGRLEADDVADHVPLDAGHSACSLLRTAEGGEAFAGHHAG